MKKKDLQIAFILFLIAIAANIAIGQETSTGLTGEDFSLDGTLEVFKSSRDLASFEAALNEEGNNINNLDLNEDGEVDYIRVIDNVEGDAHAIVLQAVVSKEESQDIAVIQIEKDGRESAILQIIGDEDIYGESMIVEPFAEEGSGGYGGPDANYDIVRVTINVWAWSPVRYIYAPRYVRYVSPWRYRYYPRVYRPWRPLAWAVWRPIRIVRPARYRVAPVHRVVVAHRVYTPVRRRSVVVNTRTTRVLAANGNRTVAKSYTTKTVVAKKGNKTVVARNTTTKGITTNGNKTVAAKKTTRVVKTPNATVKKTNKKAVGKKRKVKTKKVRRRVN